MLLAFNGIATLEFFMNIKTNTLSIVLLSALLAGCASGEDSPFAPAESSSGSSSNIISSINFGITASELNPQVLKFKTGSIVGATTANLVDVENSVSPVSSEITATAADNTGALVSSGTVYFTTQYGILSASSCELENGRCSVTWESIADLSTLIFGSIIDIQNVVTAWTYGSEGFDDLDGDDILSDNEFFYDTVEPFLDRNDNFTYDILVDDTIVNNTHDGINNVFDGPSCDSTTHSDCGSSALIPIFASVYLKMDFDATTATVLAVTIDSPADNFTAVNGTLINFSATATDPEDGTIIGPNNPVAGDNVVWISDRDGNIGNTNSISITTLTVGTHVITVRVTDSDGNIITDQITVIIT